ncbi:MAG: tyrosine-type recombinase/integrase, partial [Rhodoferax sp.]|nr:tyrosine-type recombinase/integrase [Rhodoferax sp.]
MTDTAALVEKYLEYVRVEKRLAERTVTLYALDLEKLQSLAAAVPVDLLQVSHLHIRLWIKQMHSGGRSGRGIALILSGWRGFYAWLGRTGWISSNPVQDVRSPKAPKPIPKAMGVDAAVQFAEFQSEDIPWLEVRDAAMVELLYGSGLRVAELTGLDVVASSSARGWIDMQAAQAHVLGKGSKRRSVPVGRSALAALQRWLEVRGPTGTASGAPVHASQQDAARALFTGRNGTRLTSQSVWQRLQRRSLQSGAGTPVHPHL